MKNVDRLQNALDLSFQNPALLALAMTHSSSSAAVEGSGNNERLEFLGDAVLDLVVSQELFRLYPDIPEGVLSRLRSSLVNERHLARVAAELYLGDYLVLGKGEECSGGRQKKSILASAYEALIGAVFIDRGYETARQVVLVHFDRWLAGALDERGSVDSKSQLQEKLQGEFGEAPSYALIEEQGPDHSKLFTVEVRFRGQTLGSGTAGSKKSAEKKAAKEALAFLKTSNLCNIGNPGDGNG
ncbi:MAG: ribonuclease III [Deltaproteobacteria bacterium]